MSRDVLVYIEDMIEAARRGLDYTRGLERAAFFADQRTIDAVVRNLEVLGEAAKHRPEDVRARYPAIPWRNVAGLRDILAHEYFSIDDDILWDIVQTKLAGLLRDLETVLRDEQRRSPSQ